MKENYEDTNFKEVRSIDTDITTMKLKTDLIDYYYIQGEKIHLIYTHSEVISKYIYHVILDKQKFIKENI